ncbi:hypothetical protein PG996_008958 [Apiospora saccharicola]|uniref:Uncharacterized protein n=1 Tax=Apiospora saccharicola TaxID=335842 RepID=A0ABR1UZC7_9PEZI
MPASSAKAVQFTHEVVAACDDQVELNAQSFTFDAKYTPPATVLFSLSIAVAESVFYLQFTPSNISSLKKSTCHDGNNKTRPACFDAIRHHWGAFAPSRASNSNSATVAGSSPRLISTAIPATMRRVAP